MSRSRDAGLSEADLEVIRERLRMAHIEIGGQEESIVYVTVLGTEGNIHRLLVKEYGAYRLLDRNGDVVEEADELHTLLDKVM